MTPFVFAWPQAIRDADLPAATKAVAWCWGTYMRNGDGRAYPSVTTLAAGAGVSRRTVQRALRQLEDEGFLVPAGDRRGGRGRAGEYVASLPQKGDTVTPFRPGKGVTDNRKGRHGDAPTTKNKTAGAQERRLPEGECARCGDVRPLVDDRVLYCEECA